MLAPVTFLALAAWLLALAGCAPTGDVPEADLFPPERGPHARVTPVVRYTAANLYEYIDGQAPYVVSFGFAGLATADYRRADEPVTTVDVYDMGSAENAFALFRSNANLEASPVDIGTEGAGGEGRVEFWQGRYYVAVSNPAAEEDGPVRDLARRLAADLPPTDRMPACLGWLPADGRVEASEKFLPEAYLGYEVLRNAVSARYRLGRGEAAAEVTLFACRYDSPDAAGEALAAFRTQLAERSAPVPLATAGLADLGGDGFVAEEFVMGRLVIFRAGRFLTGMMPCAADPAATSLLAALAEHVKGQQ